jgi:CO/xanthine dehydrogenase FAD-binding subunit
LEFIRPRTLEEAAEALALPNARAVAGGTAFLEVPQAGYLVDLTSLPLSYVREEENCFRVGATTTISELEESPAAKIAGGYLQQACAFLADAPLRNVITLGGNLACRHPWAHLPPVLMTLGSRVLVAGKEKREISVEEILSKGLEPGEFVQEVLIPKKDGLGVFKRFGLTKTDYAAVTVAVYSSDSEFRVAIGGLTMPTRLTELEKVVEKIEPSVMESAIEKIVPVRHPILSADYRKEVLKVLLRRALQEVGRA